MRRPQVIHSRTDRTTTLWLIIALPIATFVASQKERRPPSAEEESGPPRPKQDSKHEKEGGTGTTATDVTPPVSGIDAAETGELNKPESIISTAEEHDGHDARNTPMGRDGPQIVPDWLADPVAFVSQIVLRVQEGESAKQRRGSRAHPPPIRNFPQCVVRV